MGSSRRLIALLAIAAAVYVLWSYLTRRSDRAAATAGAAGPGPGGRTCGSTSASITRPASRADHGDKSGEGGDEPERSYAIVVLLERDDLLVARRGRSAVSAGRRGRAVRRAVGREKAAETMMPSKGVWSGRPWRPSPATTLTLTNPVVARLRVRRLRVVPPLDANRASRASSAVW
jgi:hypothetical protein